MTGVLKDPRTTDDVDRNNNLISQCFRYIARIIKETGEKKWVHLKQIKVGSEESRERRY